MKNKYINYTAALVLASASLTFTSCGGETDGDVENAINKIDDEPKSNDGTPPETFQVNIGGKFYAIPSPIQTAFLVKEEGSDFNSDLLNKAENGATYTTSFKKALNMGVYGADMGYITLYENTDLSLKYLKAVRKIANELDLAGAFNDELGERFSANMGNQDSMLVFVNDAYKNADDYLKNNDKANIAALVVVGGWVEAVYFASQTAVEKNSQKLIERVAEQKQALNNLIQMMKSLKGFAEVEEYEDLIIELQDLYKLFDQITYTYEYVEPVTDPIKNVTSINSKNAVKISAETLAKIVKSVADIRNSIIG